MKFNLVILIIFFASKIYSADIINSATQDITSPFTTNALSIAEIGSGITFLSFLLKQSSLQSEISSHHPLGKYSKIGYSLGQAIPNITYALIMGTDYVLTNSEKSLERATLIVKATLYSDAMTEILKRSVGEKRPNGNGKLAFPSGHATCAFAFSSVIMMEHSISWGIAANTMAAFVGFSRMNDNAHYLHDVIAGATIGTMYGVGLYYAEKNREVLKKSSSAIFILLPIEDGLVGNMTFKF